MNLKEESVFFIPAVKTSRYTITKKKKERKKIRPTESVKRILQ